MTFSWTLSLPILVALWQGVSMLRLADLKIPSHTVRGQPVRLECHYDLEGEALYSVKWYKDQNEFYRFLPGDDPPAQIVNLTGVIVDLPKSSDNSVTLKNTDRSGSGNYRCEVSGEAPTFPTVGESAQMIVVDLPDSGGPQIEGRRPRYEIGDTVRINCTSFRSRPAAKLSFFINQEPVDESFLQHFPMIVEPTGLETARLGLQFRVRHKYFRKGDLKIKCIATIANLYWRSNEETVERNLPKKAPVLESISPGKREASSSVGRLINPTTITLLTLFFHLTHLAVIFTTVCNKIMNSTFFLLVR